MSEKKSKAQLRREAIEAWWAREPWPCIILGVDPGRAAGATILISRPTGLSIHRCEAIDTYSRQLEDVIGEAFFVANREAFPLFLALEDWGAGGMRGINQWIGLGEARGPWRREFLLMVEEEKSAQVRKKNIAKINMTRWRSRIIPETGTRDENGKFVRFTPEEWKEAARRAALELFLNSPIPFSSDAAESLCLATFAARSDEIGKLISKIHIKRFGLDFTPLEPLIK